MKYKEHKFRSAEQHSGKKQLHLLKKGNYIVCLHFDFTALQK